MDQDHINKLLDDFKDGNLTKNDVLSKLSTMPFEDLDFAKVDHHRALRKGFPEVIFGQGKTPEQIATLASTLLKGSDRLLITKATPEAFSTVEHQVPDAEYHEISRVIVVDRRVAKETVPGLVVTSGGTSDIGVAHEATVTAELMGCEVQCIFDIGVAGLHRLIDNLPVLQKAKAIVTVAGMEGALPSVVGGLVRAPIIAVPTSVGYGTNFGGLSALLTMLNSCAPGISVVNIDNGFGAGYIAALIVKGYTNTY